MRTTHIMNELPALMLQHEKKTKANVYSLCLGSPSFQHSVYKWESIKSEDYIYFNKQKGHHTPGLSPITKFHRLINKFMNYKLNGVFFC